MSQNEEKMFPQTPLSSTTQHIFAYWKHDAACLKEKGRNFAAKINYLSTLI